jgi:hypothetical protein
MVSINVKEEAKEEQPLEVSDAEGDSSGVDFNIVNDADVES